MQYANTAKSRAGWLLFGLMLVEVGFAECVQTLHGDVFCGAGRCLIDRSGNVLCSKHDRGDAEITIHGKVLCGKGDCAKDINGSILCSSEIGGAVFVDAMGYVHCYGRCEPATVAHCEAIPADKVEDDESKEVKEGQQDD